MKRIVVFSLVVLLAVCAAWAGTKKLGQPLTLKKQVAIADVVANKDQYVGKVIQVKGKVAEVCDKAGCWMNIADEKGNVVRIKVKDGVIVFPKDAVGKTAVAEGKFVKIVMNPEQALAYAKAHAKEHNLPPVDEAKAKVETIIYQIAGTGAVINE